MKLLLRRNQKAGMITSTITFTLDVRAELTDAEKQHVVKYKLGKTMLYEREKIEGGSGLLGIASRAVLNMMNITVSIEDLVNGKHIECKNIVEMLAVEEQIKEASKTFKQVLAAAAEFGGEQVVEV